jgi:hypothetical protein
LKVQALASAAANEANGCGIITQTGLGSGLGLWEIALARRPNSGNMDRPEIDNA